MGINVRRSRPAVLVVDHDEVFRRTVARHVTTVAPVVGAGTVAQALAQVGAREFWAAFIIELNLPDGCGFSLLQVLREKHSKTPAMVLAGVVTPGDPLRARRLKAVFMDKSIAADDVCEFVEEAFAPQSTDERIETIVCEVAREYHLTPAQASVLRAEASGEQGGRLADGSRIAPSTFKTHAKAILRKTGEPRLASLARTVLRRVRGRW